MKITGVQSIPIKDEGERGYFVVKVDTDAGIYGLGEAGFRWWGSAIEKAVEHLSALVLGADPFSTEMLWQHMFRRSAYPADGVYCAAISAIDIALWDIKGKAFDMPLYQLLGGPVRDKVVCYPHTQGRSTEELIDNCKRVVDEGWRFVRWGQPETGGTFRTRGESRLEPSESIKIAEEQFGMVREAVGPDINICFDVHTRLDPPQAIEMCRNVEQYRPYFIEEPLRAENPSSYRSFARQVNVPIAVGEVWTSKWNFREVIEDESISYARIDVCNVGGLTEALKIAHWAETHYIDIAPHNPLSPVSSAVCLALCMAVSNVGVLEMPQQPGTFEKELFPLQIGWEDGYALANDAPGLGIEIDLDVAASRPYKFEGWPTLLRRNDGAFSNW